MPSLPSFRIRPARAEDATALGRMGTALARAHHGWDPDRFFVLPDPEPGYAHFLASELRKPSVVLQVAERTSDGAVVGYVYGRVEPRNWDELLDRCGKIVDVWVEPDVRRGGVARALLHSAIAAFEAHGLERVVLLRAAANGPAGALFASLGFRETMVEMTRTRGV